MKHKGTTAHISTILSALYPVKVRFSIGIGSTSTEINPQVALGMDGPAFHYAREAMEDIKKMDQTCLKITTGNSEATELINTGAGLAFAAMEGWKKNTLLIFEKMRQNKSVNERAPVLGISGRGVYKIIKTNHLMEHLNLFKALEKEMTKLIEETV